CQGGGGKTVAEATLPVIPVPTLTFSARKTEIAEGDSAQLTWRAKDAERCEASGDWSGDQGVSGSLATAPLTQDQSYTLTCVGANGEVEETVNVQVIPAPVVLLELSDALVEPGDSVTVTWESEFATSCRARGTGWSGTKETAGSETLIFDREGRRTFQLECSGVGGARTAEAELGVFPRPEITAFEASALLIQAGQTVSLSWQATESTACEAQGAWSGPRAISGSEVTAALTERNNVFTLICRGDGGETQSTLTVVAEGAPEITAFAADRELITSGESIQLAWQSRDATACLASGAWSGSKSLAGEERTEGLAAGVFEYTLRCSNAVGTDERSITVEAVTPQGAFGASELDLGTIGAKTEPPTRTFTLLNTGRVALPTGPITLSGQNAGEFVFTTDCAERLAPSESC
ncbi:MAG: hypothetical protein ACO32I_09090, partial [Candidatus Limnocylindrus sp.]